MSMVPVIPSVYHDALSKLHDDVSYVPWNDIESLIYEEIGDDIDKIFTDINKTPVAAASLAQVYKWKLRKTGENVAVKVQYPKARYYLPGDVALQMFSVWMLKIWDKNYEQVYESMKDNFKLFELELDFVNEAKNQMKCYNIFIDGELNVSAPFVHWDYTSGRLLTMEWKDGVKPTDLKALKREGWTKQQVAKGIFEAFAEMIFKHGFVHGDLHAGNILIGKNPKKPNSPEIILLDHGLYTNFSEKFRIKYAKFWKAMILGDVKYLKKYCKELGISNHKFYVSMNLMQGYDGVLSDKMHENDGQFDISSFEEMDKIKKGSKEYDEMSEIFTKLPKEMMFFMRSSFILGFINSKLGAPVNRFSIMARTAQKNCFDENTRYICKIKDTIMFESNLLYYSFQASIATIFIKVYFFFKNLGRKENKSSNKKDKKMNQMMKSFEKKMEF